MHRGRGRGRLQPLWKPDWRFLQKLKLERLFGPPIPLLGVQAKGTKPCAEALAAPPPSLQHHSQEPRYRNPRGHRRAGEQSTRGLDVPRDSPQAGTSILPLSVNLEDDAK